jgi:hypothetical protein
LVVLHHKVVVIVTPSGSANLIKITQQQIFETLLALSSK